MVIIFYIKFQVKEEVKTTKIKINLFLVLDIISILYTILENKFTLTNSRMYYPFNKSMKKV